MKIFVINLFFLILFIFTATSQECLWAERIAGNGEDIGRNVYVDNNGNIYITGDSNSPNLIFNKGISISYNGEHGIYFAKYNSEGLCLWAEKIKGNNNDISYSICVDNYENLYISGHFRSSELNFNNGIFLNNSGEYDGFLAKYNSDGICQWAEKIYGPLVEYVWNLDLDNYGNIYIVGRFESLNISFNNNINLNNNGNVNGFIAKYSTDGVCQWANCISGDKFNEIFSVNADKNEDVLISGYFESTKASFNNNISLDNSGKSDAFVAKYNSDGNCLWAKKIAGKEYEWARGVVSNDYGYIYVVGLYNSKILDFNSTISLDNNGKEDVFISKFDTDGNCLWAEKVAGTLGDSAFFIASDILDNIYIVGEFVSPVLYFNNGISISNLGDLDSYITKYNNNGICQWAQRIAGTGKDKVYSVAVYDSLNIYTIGRYYSSNIFFNNDISLSNIGSSDIYLAKYAQNCTLPSFELTGIHSICKGDTAKVSVNPNDSQYNYKWSNGSTNNTCYITEPGNYQVVVSNEFDCSDTLDFHIDLKPTFKTKVDSTIAKIGTTEAKLHFTSFITGPVNIDTLQVLYEIRFNANAFLPKDDSSFIINKIDENGYRILQLYYEKFNFSNKDTIDFYVDGTLLLGYNKINEVYVVTNTNIQNNICINTINSYIIADSVCSFETRRIKLIDLPDITLFPNPATNELKIKLKNLVDKQYNIEVYNSNGFIINTYQFFNTLEKEQFFNIDLTHFTNGMYCVLLKSKDTVLQKMFSILK